MVYKVISGSTARGLSKTVQKWIDAGCTLHGTPFFWADPGPTKNTGFCQAVVFEGSEEEIVRRLEEAKGEDG